MKKMLEIFKRKYVWTVVMAVLLIITTAYTLLDAFVIPRPYSIVTRANSGNAMDQGNDTSDISSTSMETVTGAAAAESDPADAAATDYTYKDENISINVEKQSRDGAVFYVADIRLSNASFFKTAFADNTFGKNITEATSEMAQENNAIFAINGDYCGFRDTGLTIRNGVLYRDTARSAPDNQALTIDNTGNMKIITEGDSSGASLINDGITQSFSFGPVLVLDGKAVSSSGTRVSQGLNPRTAIGQISPLHYIAIVVDGRSNESQGMTLDQLAQEFVERGATVAYNLDGGGSSTMWLNGKVINNPTDGRHAGERSVSDIIYIR